MTKRLCVVAWAGLCLIAAASCADDMDDDDVDTARSPAKVSQRPPQGAAAVEAWLKKGDYEEWQCESEVHGARSPSPHGFNRICSNDVISSRVSSDGAWPVGAAAVKELYAKADDDKPVGYAVYLKTEDDSADGANWYWYERVPADGVVADGLGDEGPAKTICVGCHIAAGTDDAHRPSAGGRDQVYTPVR